MKKIVLVLMIVTIISKILGFARDITLSYYYGASYISDAYIISSTIPLTIFVFVGTGIAVSYILIYNAIEKERGIQSADKFTSNLISFIMIICTFIVLMAIFFTTPLVKLFASGFEGKTLELAVKFTKISVIGIYFSGLTQLFINYLRLKNSFLASSLVGIPSNLVLILSIIISSIYSSIFLPIGIVISLAVQFLFLIPFILKNGYKYSFIVNKHDSDLKKMFYLSLPIMLGVSVDQINVLVDRTLASHIALGGISALTYANRLNLLIEGIFVVSITTVLYPMIAKMAADNDMKGLKNSLSEAITGVNLLVVPATVGIIAFAYPIVKLLFARGAFDSVAVNMTTSALVFFSIGMVGFGLRAVLSRAFYSLQDTKTPMINAVIAIIINIILNIILSKFLGIGGLALATSISAIVCTILLFISLRKKIGPFGTKNISISFIKILFASFVMVAIAKITYNLLFNYFGSNLSLIAAIVAGAFSYFSIIYFVRIEGVDTIVNELRTKFKKVTLRKEEN